MRVVVCDVIVLIVYSVNFIVFIERQTNTLLLVALLLPKCSQDVLFLESELTSFIFLCSR